ncbi:class Ib ribonucleoside-diphosphate reductase assembly flavoprotein NrdI (plasmid) [Rhodococcus sp. H-CA8f]|uniref:class Ib ribonucleoside-diphosphate reductase assembly flavoprotein NrdI n=1 Tax=Rhodococcus sp. H-CA8f TaxID=1727214 RepID=UPI000BE3D701|nr:class Ib ribonucleoside-diphosphate reductase assembly flavoprotein NrdI [Rhodococcus sp. H-CA8f]ATI36396.1 class Ib ribonucleoside-diphosphate reductase assembly flavoprotein NrdI [Rhodococcus sp. H-CA8f]
MSSLVYFSSASLNTHRFIQRLGIPATRIPIHGPDGGFRVEEPYVLVVPTYGGGGSLSGKDTHYVPKPVARFLNNPDNRALIRAVIASGNLNFGEFFAYAGHVISQKCGVPFLYRFELMGTAEDIVRVREGLAEFWNQPKPAECP